MAKTRLDDAGLVVLGALARESGERFHGNGALGMARFGAGSMVANSRLSISASVATTRKLMTVFKPEPMLSSGCRRHTAQKRLESHVGKIRNSD